MAARAFKVDPRIAPAMHAYVERGMTGDNPDTGLWLIPEGSAKDFIRSGFMPPGVTAPTTHDILWLDLSSEEIASAQARQRAALQHQG